jgi:5'-3' exonuclease
MGIKNFQAELKQQYSNAFKRIKNCNYNHILIDVNSLLHRACRTAKSQDKFPQSLFKLFDKILNRVAVSDSIYFALDGSAPICKLYVQRKRREAAWKKTNDNKRIGFDPRHLTPGTIFMDQIELDIQYCF